MFTRTLHRATTTSPNGGGNSPRRHFFWNRWRICQSGCLGRSRRYSPLRLTIHMIIVCLLIVLLIVGLLLLYFRTGLSSDDLFWSILPQNGQGPGSVARPGVSYCKKLHIALLNPEVFDGSEPESSDLYIYDLQTYTYYSLQDADTNNILSASPLSFPVNIPSNMHSSATACTFLTMAHNTSTGGSFDLVAVQILAGFEDAANISSKVKISRVKEAGRDELSELKSFVRPALIGYQSSMFVAGGSLADVASSTPSVIKTNDYLFRFRLNSTEFGQVEGTWSSISYTGSPVQLRRFGATSFQVAGTNQWLIYGGMKDNMSVLGDAVMFDLKILDAENSSDVEFKYSKAGSYPLRRAYSVGGSLDNGQKDPLVFLYGGTRQINNLEDSSPYVALAELHTSNSQFSFGCVDSNTNSDWCGFDADTDSTYFPAGFTYDTFFLIVWTGPIIRRLDMIMAEKSSVLESVETLDADDSGIVFEINYFWSGAFSILLLTLCVVCSQRYRFPRFGLHPAAETHQRRRKKAGLSSSAVNALPLVRYSPSGDHTPTTANVELKSKQFSSSASDSGESIVEEEDDNDQLDNIDIEMKRYSTGDKVVEVALEDDSECCGICIVEFEEEDVLRKLPCDHLFHPACVDPWLKQKSLCPLCRRSVGKKTHSKSAQPPSHDDELGSVSMSSVNENRLSRQGSESNADRI